MGKISSGTLFYSILFGLIAMFVLGAIFKLDSYLSFLIGFLFGFILLFLNSKWREHKKKK